MLYLQIALAIFTLVAAVWCGAVLSTVRALSKQQHQLLRSSSTRSLNELNAEVVSLQSSYESLWKTVRRLSSRYGMQDVRERRRQESAEEPTPTDLTPQERKAMLRRKLAEGKLRIVKDSP